MTLTAQPLYLLTSRVAAGLLKTSLSRARKAASQYSQSSDVVRAEPRQASIIPRP